MPQVTQLVQAEPRLALAVQLQGLSSCPLGCTAAGSPEPSVPVSRVSVMVGSAPGAQDPIPLMDCSEVEPDEILAHSLYRCASHPRISVSFLPFPRGVVVPGPLLSLASALLSATSLVKREGGERMPRALAGCAPPVT